MTATTPEPSPARPAGAAGPPASGGPAGGAGPAGPGRRPPARPGPRPARSRNTGGGAVVVAVGALLLAVGAVAVALYALDVAREAKSRAAIAASRDLRATPTVAPVSSPTVPGNTAPPSASPTAVFLPVRLGAELTIPVPQGCASAFVDVDSLVVGVDAGHEFYLSRCQGPLVFRVDHTGGAAVATSATSPQQCVEATGTGPTGTELVLLAQTGLAFCLLTAEDGRADTPQLIGIVEVARVAVDESVSVTISTYRRPG